MATSIRIRNSYLLFQLELLISLGSTAVSARQFVNAWKKRGRSVDELFFLHLDTLSVYGFLVTEPVGETEMNLEPGMPLSTMLDGHLQDDSPGAGSVAIDYRLTVTHEGQEFSKAFDNLLAILVN